MSTFPGKHSIKEKRGGDTSSNSSKHLAGWLRDVSLEQNARLRKQCLDNIIYHRIPNEEAVASELQVDVDQMCFLADSASQHAGSADGQPARMEEKCPDFTKVWRPLDETKSYPRGFCKKTPTKLNTSTSPIYRIPANICHSKNSSIIQGLYGFEVNSSKEEKDRNGSPCFNEQVQSRIEWITSSDLSFDFSNMDRQEDLKASEDNLTTNEHVSHAFWEQHRCILLCNSLLQEVLNRVWINLCLSLRIRFRAYAQVLLRSLRVYFRDLFLSQLQD